MTHVALDLALGITGFAGPGGSGVLRCPKDRRGGARLAWWASRLDRYLRPLYEPSLEVVVEAPFMHGTNVGNTIDICKLHGVCEFVAHNVGPGIRYVQVDNQTLKSYAVRLGAVRDGRKLPKEEMIRVARTLGCDPETDDEADAFLLWHYWQDKNIVRGNSAPVIGGGS